RGMQGGMFPFGGMMGQQPIIMMIPGMGNMGGGRGRMMGGMGMGGMQMMGMGGMTGMRRGRGGYQGRGMGRGGGGMQMDVQSDNTGSGQVGQQN
ncbi:MAG: hypothetical protein EZS28_025850, partial [Streblomastix strix]